MTAPRDVYSMMEDFFEEEEEREDEVDDVEQEEDTAFDEEQIVVDDPCRKVIPYSSLIIDYKVLYSVVFLASLPRRTRVPG